MQGLGLADVRQADETDGLRVLADTLGQFVAGFEALRGTSQLLALAAQYQLLERIEGPGIVITGIQAYRPRGATESLPVIDFSGEQRSNLGDIQLLHGIVRVHDDRQPVQGDDLFGAGTAQVPQAGQTGLLAVLDRPRGGGQLGAAFSQCDKTGARAMGGDSDLQQAPLGVPSADAYFVRRADLLLGMGNALLTQQAGRQGRRQVGTDGVGALDAQQQVGLASAGRPGHDVAAESQRK